MSSRLIEVDEFIGAEKNLTVLLPGTLERRELVVIRRRCHLASNQLDTESLFLARGSSRKQTQIKVVNGPRQLSI